jgi:PKD repeat protein
MKNSPRRDAIRIALRTTALAGALISTCALGAPRTHDIHSGTKAGPVLQRIAIQRRFDLRLGATDMDRTLTVRSRDASFIKLHFDHISLPDGVVLELFSPDRRQLLRYSSRSRDAYTVDATMGQDGRTAFSAMSIHGPVVMLRLTGSSKRSWRPDEGVRISRFLEGFPERAVAMISPGNASPGTRSIIGKDDKQAVACYASSDPSAYDRTRPVARLVKSSGGICTAWRVGPDNHLLTNNHCIDSASSTASTEIWFDYQLSTCGGTASTPVKVAADRMLSTDATLDYTLFTVKDFESISRFGHLGLEVRAARLHDEIFIAGHPGGRRKELSVVSDQDGGRRCRINDESANGNGTDTDIGYYCDTEGGSSGSPVIARDSNKAIALHHLGGSMNKGAKMSLIWPRIASHFGNVIPAGDDTPPSNAAPVASFTTSTSNLTANFTDTSIDSDGSIASRAWDFGDGGTSTVANPSHTYAAAGTYSVKLTVTDDKGASNAVTRSVSVTAAPDGVQTYANETDIAIPDNTTINSRITVSDRTGNAPRDAKVSVNIVHPKRGQLTISLVAPDGTAYTLKRSDMLDTTANVNATYTVNLSSEALNGTWRLRVNDFGFGSTGRIDRWSAVF